MVYLASAIVGKESTVIQFGTDQMIEASSAQVSTFMHVGNVCANVISACLVSQCYFLVEDFFDGVYCFIMDYCCNVFSLVLHYYCCT